MEALFIFYRTLNFLLEYSEDQKLQNFQLFIKALHMV